MESSALFSGPWKRVKAERKIGSCLVDGCDADLRLCRDYHRRHKVCEIHSKTPKVIVGGRDQRFCQQCSRFHSLVEFDEVKRSCRKRLDGHNRRRRKPQPNSVFSRNSGFMSASQQGTRFYSFSTPQVLASAAVGEPEDSTVTYKNRLPSYKAVNLQFIQGSDPAAVVQETSAYQPFLDPKSASGRCKDFSDQARSLLSSAHTLTQEFGLSPAFQTEPMLPSQKQSVVQNWLYTNDLGPFTLTEDVKPVVSAAVSHGGNIFNTINIPEMIRHGSSTNGTNQTHTFLWE